MNEIVVTAKGCESRVFNTSLPINIIGPKDIERIQPVSTADLFKNHPGIDISQTGMGTERPMIRGLYDSQVLILVDGIKLSEQRAGGDHALSIDPSQIERVEVVRGPVSVLYGSGAIGGVINFITKKQRNRINDELRFNGSIVNGYDSATCAKLAGISMEGGYGGFNYYLGGTYKETGDVTTPRGKLDNSSVDDYNYSGGFSYNWGKTTLSLSGFGSYANIEVPTFNNDFLEARFRGEQHYAAFLNFERREMSDRWTSFKIDGAFQRHHRRMRILNPSCQPIRVDVDFDTYNVNVQSSFRLGGSQAITGGIQSFLEKEESDRLHPSSCINGVGVIPPSTRLGLALFAQDEITVGSRFIVTVGVRYDWFRSENRGELGHPIPATVKYDGNVNGNIGALFALIKDHLNITANIGRAFRAPTLHERFFYGPHQVTADYGNPNLDPETSWNFDAGVKVNTKLLWFTANAFYNRIDDYIERQLIGGSSFGLPNAKFANVSEASLYGGEAEAEIRIAFGFTLFGNLTYVRGRNTADHRDLSSIPPLKGTYGLRYETEISECDVWAEFSALSAARQIYPGTYESETPGYTAMDIRAGFRLNDKLSVTVYCKNIADRAYHDHLSRITTTNAPEVNGLEQAGRSYGGSAQIFF
ncbi:MAG: TonB-dependent receptor [Spirochaetes bacterium]|nr:TonB-dependent receptor [Spirochaetota bacterium]